MSPHWQSSIESTSFPTICPKVRILTYIASLYEVKARLEDLSKHYKDFSQLPNPADWTDLNTSNFQAEGLGPSVVGSRDTFQKIQELKASRTATMSRVAEYVGGHRIIKPGSLLQLGTRQRNPLVFPHDDWDHLTVTDGSQAYTIAQEGKWDTEWGRTIVTRHHNLYHVAFMTHGPGRAPAPAGQTDYSDMSTDPEGFTKVVNTAITAHDVLISALNGE